MLSRTRSFRLPLLALIALAVVAAPPAAACVVIEPPPPMPCDAFCPEPEPASSVVGDQEIIGLLTIDGRRAVLVLPGFTTAGAEAEEMDYCSTSTTKVDGVGEVTAMKVFHGDDGTELTGFRFEPNPNPVVGFQLLLPPDDPALGRPWQGFFSHSEEHPHGGEPVEFHVHMELDRPMAPGRLARVLQEQFVLGTGAGNPDGSVMDHHSGITRLGTVLVAFPPAPRARGKAGNPAAGELPQAPQSRP